MKKISGHTATRLKMHRTPGLRWQEFVSRGVRPRIFHLLEIILLIGGIHESSASLV